MGRLSSLPKRLELITLQEFNLNTVVAEAIDNVRWKGSNDLNIIGQLESIPPVKGDINQLHKEIIPLLPPEAVYISAETKEGIDRLIEMLAELTPYNNPYTRQ